MNAHAHVLALSAGSALFVGCSTSASRDVQPMPDDGFQARFAVAPTEFVSRGANPYFVLEPGYRITLEGQEDGEMAQLVITVLDATEVVDGVETRVVEERESEAGELVEVSRNFFALSRTTNDVYYFGEDVDIYRDGKVVKHEGAWRSGVAGAKFGLFMPGRIEIGGKYYQEVAPGVALDRFEVVSTDAAIETPAGRLEHCLKVEETTPLEPKNREHKHYARGIGLVQDGGLRLVSHGRTPGAR